MTCVHYMRFIEEVMSKFDEPRYTCSGIDSAKDEIIDMLREVDNLSSRLSDLGKGKACLLEELRDSNVELRAWGQAWKEEAERFESELEEMRYERDRFERLYDEAYEELSELRWKVE